MLFKCCNQYISKFGKLSSGHRTEKGQFSFQSQRRAMPMNVQTAVLKLFSFHNWSDLAAAAVHASKVLLKILQARLQQYMNGELPDVQARFRKGRRIRVQTVNIHWVMEKAREFHKNIYFSFIDYAKAFDCVDHNKLWKILQRWE